jgi:hypothetical protein
MCGTSSEADPDRWQAELPDSPGDWLWLQCFSCGCVIASGIAWVSEHEIRADEMIRDGDRPLYLSWQAPPERQPLRDATGQWHVDYWMKLTIPRED